MTKAKIIDKGLETIILQERFYLAKLNSPFVVNVLCSFQDKNNLFIVMELLSGGDLQFHILNYDYYFTETQLKFLMTNLILGIEYIHKKGLIHCNLKPDNIMFDSHGFAKIIGFGDSCLKGEIIDEKLLNVDASEYMAPEVLDQEEIDFTADFFSLGAVGYKLISGKEYNEEKDIDLTKNEKLKEKYSDFCLEFISKLLNRNKNKRLGSKEYEKELKQHDFLMGMKWDLIKKGVFISPIIDIIKFSRINSKYNELFDYDLCNKTKDEPTPEELNNYMEIIEGVSYPMYFQYYTCMRVHNILRELSKDDNVAKDDYYFLAKDKKVRKSQSSRQLLPSKKKSEINDENHHHHHHHHHQHFQPKKKYENIYELPYISNKTEKEFRKREHKIKDYYENKLLKYKDHIKKLKNDNQIQYIQAQYVDQNHPIYKSFFPPPPPKKIHPHRHLNYNNNYNYESKRDNYLPRIPPPLPPQREYKEMPNTMERVMARFYNQMSKDRNNFFIKFNKKNYFDKKNDDSQYDDYSSSDSSGLEPEEKYSKNKLIDIPYVNPNYPNVQYHNYINKNEIKNNNMIPGMVKVEEYTETVESEESETTSIRHINGMNGRSIEKRSLSTMNIGNGIYDNYYQNQNKEIKSNKEETEEEESEEEEEEEEDDDDENED